MSNDHYWYWRGGVMYSIPEDMIYTMLQSEIMTLDPERKVKIPYISNQVFDDVTNVLWNGLNREFALPLTRVISSMVRDEID